MYCVPSDDVQRTDSASTSLRVTTAASVDDLLRAGVGYGEHAARRRVAAGEPREEPEPVRVLLAPGRVALVEREREDLELLLEPLALRRAELGLDVLDRDLGERQRRRALLGRRVVRGHLGARRERGAAAALSILLTSSRTVHPPLTI